jgi:hypothetical protein
MGALCFLKFGSLIHPLKLGVCFTRTPVWKTFSLSTVNAAPHLSKIAFDSTTTRPSR